MPIKPTTGSRSRKSGKTARIPKIKSQAATADPLETPAVSEPCDAEVFDSTQHHEEIAQVAHALWQERGCADGSADEDWRRAEEQVKRKYASAGS